MNFIFKNTLPPDVLHSYLSRAVTHSSLLASQEPGNLPLEDDLRMLTKEGAKFIGRAAYVWDYVPDHYEHLRICRERAEICHNADSEFILQCCVFECVRKDYCESIKIPEWVFDAFEAPFEDRCFSMDKMSFADGKFKDHWGKNTIVPDIMTLEGRMWIYYLSCEYMKLGCEAIHFGQVWLIGANDTDWQMWDSVVTMIREFAKTHARRGYVICDAHCHGLITKDGRSILDFNSFPIRLKEVEGEPMKCVCEEMHSDSLFGRNRGGVPFLVEFDNWGISKTPGEYMNNGFHAWGYDEITWFSLQPKEYRSEFLSYILNWVTSKYSDGHVQMPSHRVITTGKRRTEGRFHYSANNELGWGDEDTITELWNK